MAVETELKLRIAPNHMARLKRHPFLKALAAEPARSRKLYNIYYDTRGLELQSHAMALRLRRIGRHWLQTLKGGGGVEAGLHSRNEWETPVAGEALDFAALEACGGKLPAGVKRQSLRPVFATDFTRSVRLLNFEGAVIELGMDSGEIRAGTRSRPISELELELKSGEPEQLFRLALALLDIVPLEAEHASKAEYGYRLYRGRKPGPSAARLPELDGSQPVASALRGILSACLLHVQGNLPGSLWRPEGDYRVELRSGMERLATVLDIAAAWRQDAELAALRAEVAGLCAELAAAHEWEVFTGEILPRIRAQADHPALGRLLRASAKRNKEHAVATLARLAAPDVTRLILRIGLWMQGGYWQAPGAARLAVFAKRTLRAYSKPLRESSKALPELEAACLHDLVVACHRLRDGIEIFGALFGAEGRGAYIAALANLQSCLGSAADMVAARRLVQAVAGAADAEVRARIDAWLDREQQRQAKTLRKAWERFAGQGAFWV